MDQRDSGDSVRASRGGIFPGAAFFLLAVTLAGMALFRHSLPVFLKPLFFQLACALLVASAGFISTVLVGQAQARGPFSGRRIALPQLKRPLPRFLEEPRQRVYQAANFVLRIDWFGDGLPLAVSVLLSAAALYAAVKGWRSAGELPLSAGPWIVGSLTAAAFPLLVLERHFASLPNPSGDGQALTYLVRLLLLTLLGLALSYVLRWFALPFPLVIEHAVLIICMLVAGEFLLRGLSYLFLPLPPPASRSHATSLLASVLRLQRPSLNAIGASVSRQFGIDLGRSWALMFIRRAFLPMLGGLVVCGWLLTGVSALDLSQRAVYEAFGRPQTVFHSGIHVYLPWPFGRLRPVEYGVVREIPIAFPDEGDFPATPDPAWSEKGTIEGPPPMGADRLWEASRPTEASYLVASNQNGHETFEVLNIDLRIAYRIGLSDNAAYSAAYSLAAPDDLIRAAAGRMLARYFARSTVSAVLGENRANFIRGFQKELQARLDSVSPGIDILGVVIETVHPPAGVADAYQQAQAASIDAVTKVANAKGDATRDLHQAQADATEARDTATAQAAETVADAKVGTALFAGDIQAYHQSGAAFLFERRLADISAAITPDTHLLVVDHRVPAGQMQLLGMRAPGVPAVGGGE